MLKRIWARWVLWRGDWCLKHGDYKWAISGCCKCNTDARVKREAKETQKRLALIARENKAREILNLP